MVTREFTWGVNAGGGIGGLLNLNQSGADYSYLYDGKGNVMAVLDPTQSVVASYRYGPFGKLLSKSGTLDQSYTFSTKRYDENTGLNYFGFRYYNPAIGRWLTRDPLGEAGGMNLYGFVVNSPVNFVDPLGFYGTQQCAYYSQACKASGGPYECYIAGRACNAFPKGNETMDFIRQCLQEKHKARQPEGVCSEEGISSIEDITVEHAECFYGCGMNTENPYDPSGPDLPSNDINLY